MLTRRFCVTETAVNRRPERRQTTKARAEIFLDLTLGYFLDVTWRSGVAYGFDEGGGFTFYSHLGVPF